MDVVGWVIRSTCQHVVTIVCVGNGVVIVDLVAGVVPKARPGAWIVGRGWHQAKWDDRPSPNIEGLPLHHKLSEISQLTGYLKPDGIFLANLDTNNIFDAVGNNKGKKINSVLRSNGMTYDTRKNLLRCNAKKNIKFPFQYLGADDRFGKNYTGQKVVASYYKI